MQILNKFDLLKFLIDNMNPDTHEFIDENHILNTFLDGEKQSEYATALRNEGFINVYMGATFEVLPKAIQQFK